MADDKKKDLEDGQRLGRLTDRDDAADADTQEGDTPQPAEPPPTDPGGGVLEGGRKPPQGGGSSQP